MRRIAELGVVAGIAFAAGILGGWAGARFGPAPEALKARTLVADRIECREIATPADKGYSLLIKDGSILATKAIVGAEVRGVRILGNGLMVIDDEPRTPFEECHITAQLQSSKGGGLLYLHNAAGKFVPKEAPLKSGHVMFMGYNDQGLPGLFAQDIARGEQGKVALITATLSPPVAPAAPAAPAPAAPAPAPKGGKK